MATTHHWAGYEVLHDPRTHAAQCSCGWKSERRPTAELAVDLWDKHLKQAAASVLKAILEGDDA